MRKVIILQNQHFLKKNYTYNFFRSILKSNTIFLKNNLFFLKFYNLINFFFFSNFFFKKVTLLNLYKNTLLKSNSSIFLKKKIFKNYSNYFYGNNYITVNKKNLLQDTKILIYKDLYNYDIHKHHSCNLNFLFNFNNNFIYNYISLLLLLYLK